MNPTFSFILIVTLVTAIYIAECAWWPFQKHPKCKGTGKRLSPDGKSWGVCKGCKGSGRRLRTGRKVWNYIQRRKEEAA